MKKNLALIMSVMLVIAALSTVAFAEDTTANAGLTVGSVTQLSGNFFSSMWGNNTSDIDVRQLLHDYQTIAWTSDGLYTVNNTVVQNVTTSLVGGNRRYIFTLFNDLYFSDGSNITAKDYVFSILLESSPQVAAIGGSTVAYSHLVGYEAFATGESDVFSGVRLLGNYTFSLDVSSEFIPYFYELAFASVTPYPLAAIAPGADVADTGNGAYITGPFTADVLQQTILDPVSGYLSHPMVTSGAYMLTGYDADAHIAKLSINPYFKGNYEGQKPSIETLTFKQVWNESMLDELQNHTVDLINKVSSGDVIRQAGDLELAGSVKTLSYLRTGFAFLSFASEAGITQSVKLRQAVAHSIDENAITEEFLQGNGVPVYGYYGFGQWFIADVQDQLTELDIYQPDTNAAIALLEDDGWIYNANGDAYVQGTDDQRYRMVEGNLEPLTLKLAISTDNQAGRIAARMLNESFQVIGAKLEVSEIPMSELLQRYYRQADRMYDMFFLATNFPYIYDPYYYVNTGDEFQGVMNTTGLRDEQLMDLAIKLRETSPTDLKSYEERWLDFQKRFVELEPVVPLYSNVYYDIMRPDLNNYFANNYWSWSVAILYATIGDAAQVESAAVTP
ncbi:MAG TPA: ABC transporter substrate-binding protein [Candidatus Limiplasma sp.]|nr:ABC transporter substrate-binding protein [Candidatus Limiplasma sp.]HRX07638.1 ABC transporter substrate-binding protein [Candidatus Limiplasma sp.]